MHFTYESYRHLIGELKQHKYEFCTYGNFEESEKSVILRHDIDTSVEKAVELAQIEREEGVFATYFVLVSTDFYNIHSKKTAEGLKSLANCGGVIGLHFDETRYNIDNDEQMIRAILNEKTILQSSLGIQIEVVSMHRPSKKVLSHDIKIPGMINTYGDIFFKRFKYVSDSRMHWREDVEQIVASGLYNRLHILTHAFWYYDKEMSAKEIIAKFVDNAKFE